MATPAGAVECVDTIFDSASFTICKVDAETETLDLFLYDTSGAPFGDFNALPVDIAFAMNAGMYHPDRSPVGHYVENGQVLKRVIPNAGPGNFGMLPNGIFCIRDDRTDVFETGDFVKLDPRCKHATQSGPMLVVDGQLHPRFLKNSPSRYIRNGVGTSIDGRSAFFAISNQRVNFYTFGRLFRDHIGVKQALYFDGNISRLYAPSLNRHDFGARLGPIVAVTH